MVEMRRWIRKLHCVWGGEVWKYMLSYPHVGLHPLTLMFYESLNQSRVWEHWSKGEENAEGKCEEDKAIWILQTSPLPPPNPTAVRILGKSKSIVWKQSWSLT